MSLLLQSPLARVRRIVAGPLGLPSPLAGRTVLVTGASSGIGHAVAVQASERGAKVAVAARRTELLTELAEKIGGWAFELDVEDPAAITRVVGEAAETLGGFDAVVFTSTLTAIVTSATEAVLRPPHSFPPATKRQIGMFLTYGVGAGICGLLAVHAASIAVLPFVTVVGAAGFHWRAGQQKGRSTSISAQ